MSSTRPRVAFFSDEEASPSFIPSRAGARVSAKLLQATLASLRCRDAIEDGAFESAQHQLMLLRDALDQIDVVHAEPALTREVELLRTQESKLSRLIAGTMKRVSQAG